MKDIVIALDIGGTSMKGAIVEENGNILYKESFDVDANHTTEEHKKRIKEVIEKLKSHIPADYKVIGLGIDSPGVMNKETLHLGGAENIPGLHGLKFSDIGDLFNLPVKTVNDASAAALGEAKYGSGKEKNYQSIMFITLGTGVGGGFVLNGKLFTGALGGAGELGHVFVVPDGDRCNCGSSGCIERYASAMGFIKTARNIDLDLVLIGGGLCKDFDMMINDIKRGVQNYGLRMMVNNLEIKPASLGNDAGVLGCAALFFRNN